MNIYTYVMAIGVAHWTSDNKGQCDPRETGNKVSPVNTLAYCSEFPGFSAGRGKPVDFQSHLLNLTREYGAENPVISRQLDSIGQSSREKKAAQKENSGDIQRVSCEYSSNY